MDAKTVIQMQIAEIERLRAELGQLQAENHRLLGWIMGEEPDALVALQRIYSDPQMKGSEIVKAASAAIGYERPKPPSSSVVAITDWKEYTKSIRLRTLELRKAEWAQQKLEAPGVAEDDALDPEPAA